MRGHNIIRTKDASGKIQKEFDIANCVEDAEVVRNNIEARCSVIRGELMYNVLLGIPLRVDKDDMDLAVMNIINNTAGVREINKFSSNIIDKVYRANIIVITTMSEVINVEV